MILLKDLSKFFLLQSYDNGKTQILNALNQYGTYNVRKYVGHIEKIKKGWYKSPGRNATNNLEQLLKDIDDRLKSFKYNSEFYNPLFRAGYFCEIVITDYLRSKGFKHADTYNNCVTYTLGRENVYGLTRGEIALTFINLECFSHEYKNNKLPETIDISLSTSSKDGSWVSTKSIKRDPDDIIEAIETIMKPLLLSDSVSDYKLASDMNNVGDIDIVLSKAAGLGIKSKPYKEELINKLEETLKALKSA